MRIQRVISVLIFTLLMGSLLVFTPVNQSSASDFNNSTIGAVIENGSTTIWLRMCGTGSSYQLRSEYPGSWISELFNRTGSNGCSPSTGGWWRAVVGGTPGQTYKIYSSNTDTYLNESQFMARARQDTCTIIAQGSVSCTRQTVTAPGMDINEPSNGQTIQGIFTIRGWAADFASTSGSGVSNVQIKLIKNNIEVFSQLANYGQTRSDVASVYGDSRFTNTGYTLSLNTANLENGTYILRVSMQSAITQQWSPNERTIIIGQSVIDTIAPDGSITSPQNQQTFSSTFSVNANAYDNAGGSGISRVGFYIKVNGNWELIAEDSSVPYSITWTPPTSLQTQMLTLALHIHDNAGNIAIDPGGYRFISFIRSPSNENWISNRYYLNQLALGTNGWQMCSMASIAMIRASSGMIAGNFESLRNEAFRAWNSGLRAPGITKVKSYLDNNGFQTTIIWDKNKETHWNAIKQEIDANRPVILNSNSNGGNLTNAGHYIVIVGYRNAPNINQREVIAYDPYGRWTGTKGNYVRNTSLNAEPGGVRGRFVYYKIANLGTIYSLTARRRTFMGFGSTDKDKIPWILSLQQTDPTTLPDELFVEANEEIVIYEGHGQDQWPVQVYFPHIQSQ